MSSVKDMSISSRSQMPIGKTSRMSAPGVPPYYYWTLAHGLRSVLARVTITASTALPPRSRQMKGLMSID